MENDSRHNSTRVAIMQPYVFPYIGYFHLISACDIFVFYDDVNYINRGWINRNKMLNQGKALLFTIPLQSASQNKMIMEIAPAIDARWQDKFYKQLVQNYKKAPYFTAIVEPLMSVFSTRYTDMTDLAIESIQMVYTYLDRPFFYVKSSICSPDSRGLDKADRLIQITKKLGGEHYINAIGGQSLYTEPYFQSQSIDLSFVRSLCVDYKQYDRPFVPGLSIIDILMFNSKDDICTHLDSYTLIKGTQ